MSIFSTATLALQSAQTSIATISHNIANANTVGYRRQEVVFETNTSVQTGSGFIGQGVSIATVRRIYSDFLDQQVTRNEAEAGYLDQYLQGMQQINNILGDRSIGFSSMVQRFFATWNDLADSPTSIPARQAVIGAAESLASNINSVGSYLQSLQDSVNADIVSMVGRINSYAQNIAELNDRITTLQISATQAPNDLLDERDQLVSELNQLAGATAVKDSTTGSYSIFLGRGYQLVGVAGASSITARASVYDPLRMEIYGANGGVQLSGNLGIIGGQLGGLLDYRAEMLDFSQNSLGQLSIVLAQSVNDQHKLGLDLNGNAGDLFFSDPANYPRTYRNTNNNGNGVVSASVTDASQLTISDYQLSYDGTDYTLLRLSDGQTWSNASLATLATNAAQGFSISLDSGSLIASDSFLIRPTVAGSTNIGVEIFDPASVAAAAPVAVAAATTNTGTTQFTQPAVDTSTQPPLNANLTATVTITFTGTGTFDVTGTGTGNPTNVPYTSGGDISYNGWTFQITGTPAVGDVFTVSLNSSGVLDNRNALAMAALQRNRTLVGGNATLESSYAAMVGSIGNKTSEVTINQKAQSNLLTQARQAQQSASGVNLDEEASNLIRYQQAYQAAAKMIQTANTMFEALLDL
jgi:flagellar hook-associated protein 1 FlgK